MRGWGFHVRTRRGVAAALLALGAPLTLTACAASSYAGVPLRAGAADPRLQQLARRAQSGDKHAQLELGKHLEIGCGVSRDRRWARRLLRQASRDSGGTLWVYAPGVSGAQGRLAPVSMGPPLIGIAEAQARLAGRAGQLACTSAGLVEEADFEATPPVGGLSEGAPNPGGSPRQEEVRP